MKKNELKKLTKQQALKNIDRLKKDLFDLTDNLVKEKVVHQSFNKKNLSNVYKNEKKRIK